MLSTKFSSKLISEGTSYISYERKYLYCVLRWGKRPIDEAETFGHMQVVEYLNNYAISQKTEAENKEKENGNNNGDGDQRKVESTAQTPLP